MGADPQNFIFAVGNARIHASAQKTFNKAMGADFMLPTGKYSIKVEDPGIMIILNRLSCVKIP